jgi:RHS repeat-associated protein
MHDASIAQEGAPRAGLNYLFFDKGMNLLPMSGVLTLGGLSPNVFNSLSMGEPVAATEPGYLIVYVDNQSLGKDVWFDNIQILHYNAEVQEETHYYPFGLTLSSSGFGVEQPYKYQGIELEKNFGLETYETFYRGLDPQLGRWNGIDIKSEKYYHLSPYVAMGNNPVMLVDPLGDDTWVYGSNGVLGVHIKDNLPNQIHFLDKEYEKYAGTYSGKDANDLSKTIRAGSKAFIGENSVKSAKALAEKSAKIDKSPMMSGQELGVVAEVSESREIIFKELPVSQEIKNKADYESYPMGEAKDYYNKNVGNINDNFGLGHTHTKAWYRPQPGGMPGKDMDRKSSLEFYGKPSYPDDYSTRGLRTNMPLFILSPVGLTIYKGSQLYNSEKSVHRYDSIKK